MKAEERARGIATTLTHRAMLRGAEYENAATELIAIEILAAQCEAEERMKELIASIME